MTARDPADPTPLAGRGIPLPGASSLDLLRRLPRARGKQRHAHLRDLGFRALARVTPSVAIDDRGTRVHLRTDDEVSRLVYIFGLYDEALLQRALDVLAALGRPDALAGRGFLDVGANIGTSVLSAMRLGAGTAVAVEPHPGNVTSLRINLLANGWDERVRVVQAAASDAAGTVALELDPENSGDHRVRVAGARGEPGRSVIEVPAVTLDSLELDPAELGLAWFDAQGHEARVLEGGRELLAHDIPLVAEYWPYGLRAAGDLDRLHALLGERYAQFVDLRDPFEPGGGVRVRPAGEVARLADAHREPGSHTELLVLPR